MEAPDDELPRAPTTRASEARRVYIRRDVELARYGMTDGCQGCTAAHLGTTAMPHSEECRSRIMREMEIDKDDRLEAANKRMLDAAASAQQKPGTQARVGESRGGVRTSTGSGGGVRTPEGSADIPIEGVAVPSAPIDGPGVAVASVPHEEPAARRRRLDAFGVVVDSAPVEGDELDFISFTAYDAAEAGRPKSIGRPMKESACRSLA